MKTRKLPVRLLPSRLAAGGLFLLLFGLLLAACAGAPLQGDPAPAVDPAQSIIFHNGLILTMDAARPQVQALAIQGEKVAALGSSAEILALRQSGTVVIDLGGRTLMPGFVDAHTHILNDARSQGRSLDQGQYLALRNGITTLGDLYADEPFVREMQAFAEAGMLRVRTSLYLVANDNCGREVGNWYKRYASTRQPGEMLRTGGVKIFTDGGSCGGVALSFELQPGSGQGDLWLEQEELNAMVAEAQAAGYQVAIHAIGDRAAAQAQAAIAFALAGGPNTYRHRMEHVSVLPPELIPRFGELGIVPVLNGQYPACIPFGPPIPEGFREWEWPWRALRDANPDLPVAWHSDYPFLSVNPFVHLYGFVTRQDVYTYNTCSAADWLLDDTLTVEESLSIMTLQSAYALFREEEVGSLEPGKYADLIILSGDPLTLPVDELRRITVLATMVGGRFEFCNPSHPDLCPAYPQRTPLPLPDLRPPVAVRWLALVLAVVLPLAAAIWSVTSAKGDQRTKLSGVAAILGGGLWAFGMVYGMSRGNEALVGSLIAAGFFLAVASLGLKTGLAAPRLGAVGRTTALLGAVTLAVGLIVTYWFRMEDVWFLIFVGVFVHLIGLILVGLTGLYARPRRLRGLLPFGVALFSFSLPNLTSVSIPGYEWPFVALGIVLGLGWIWMGGLLLAGRGELDDAVNP